MIIDIRCRLTTGQAADYFVKTMKGRKLPPALAVGTEEAFFRELDSAGVTVAVGPSGNNAGMTLGKREFPPRTTPNDVQGELQDKFPDRFIGVASIDTGNGAHNALDELKKCVLEYGLKVATIEPGRRPMNAENPADPRLFPFYELAQEMKIPVIIQTSGIKGGVDFDYANPRWIDRIAHLYPDLHILCAHGCYPFVREMIAVAQRHRNVFPSPDVYYDKMGAEEWLDAVNRENISQQFLFGSGYPLVDALKPFVDRFFLKRWRPAVLDDILYRNAIRALKLENDPRFKDKLEQPVFWTPGRVAGRRAVALKNRVLARLSG